MTAANEVRQDYSYTKDHEWISAPAAQAVGAKVKIGITAKATCELGDIVFLDLPEEGSEVTAGEACGEVESTKSVSQLFAPVSGKVTAVNQAAIDEPSVVNDEPYEGGWLFEVEVTAVGEVMDADAYLATAVEN